MADPLSLAASILAVIGGINVTCQGIQRVLALKKAPKRLLETHNKIEELKVLLNVIQDAAESLTINDPNVILRFQRLTARAQDAINEANQLIRVKLVKNPESLDDPNAKIEIRERQLLRNDTKLGSINTHLSDILQSINTAISSISALQLSSIKVTLSEVRYDLYRLQLPGSLLQHDYTPTSAEIDNSPEASSAQDYAMSLHDRPLLESGANSDSVQHDLPEAAHIPEQIPERDPVGRSGSEYVQVDLNVSQRDVSRICGCSCHSPLALRTPSWVGNAVGMLLVRWYRNPRACDYCLRRKCDALQKESISARYFFPMWMVSRFIELESAWTASKRLSVSFRTSRIIPDDSNVFTYTQHNNLDGVKRLFKQGLASPFDTSMKGRTPLHFAVSSVQIDMVEFLVKQGAELGVEDNNFRSPQDGLWEAYLRNPRKRGHFLTAAGLSFGDTESTEKLCPTGLHRIVLGFGGSVNLEHYLQISGSEINVQDWSGKTVLCWAAQGTDAGVVRTLLNHNASVTSRDNRNKTPLHYSTGNPSGVIESVEMILEQIKELEGRRESQEESLIEACDDKGRTPLNYATRKDLPTVTQVLLDAGANVNAIDTDTCRSILLNAIYWNSHKVLALLLDRGARTDVKDKHGASLLHYIARFADLQTLQIMSDHYLGSIDTSAVDSHGSTALSIFNSADARCPPEEGPDRQLAMELFARIMLDVSRPRDDMSQLVELDDGGRVQDVFQECEEAEVGDADSGAGDAVDISSISSDEIPEEMFYSAMSSFE